MALVDIGGGTTDLALFVNGAICHTAVRPPAATTSPTTSRWGCARRSGSRAHQGQVRLRAGEPGGRRADDRGAQRGRGAAGAVAPHPVRGPAAAHGRSSTLQEEIERAGYDDCLTSGLVVTAEARSSRGSRDRRADLRSAGAPWRTRRIGDSWTGGEQPHLFHGRGLVMYGALSPVAAQRVSMPGFLAWGRRPPSSSRGSVSCSEPNPGMR